MALARKERDILLCVSSKNDETIAPDAFRNHPEMILKEDDIVAFRVNWDDKAANIKAIVLDARGLRIGGLIGFAIPQLARGAMRARHVDCPGDIR
jgi:predicted enzyme involved in methoxymalonyl-ACP biosynthesis